MKDANKTAPGSKWKGLAEAMGLVVALLAQIPFGGGLPGALPAIATGYAALDGTASPRAPGS
jgi:hypothetical protein